MPEAITLIDAIAAIPTIGPTPGLGLVVPQFCRQTLRIAHELWIGPIPHTDHLLKACEPRGYNTIKAFRQFHSPYGFYRTYEDSAQPNRHEFDPDTHLRTCLQLSRLVRPTSVSYEYAAQIWNYTTDAPEIIPAGFTGVGSQAFVLDEDQDWFRDEDVEALQRLLQAFQPTALSQRLSRGLWYHEYLSWLYLVDMRWPLTVTALEALIHTDESDRTRRRLGSTEQFVRRLSKLKEFVPSLQWTDGDLEVIYDHRSAFVHGVGERLSELGGEERRLIGLAEHGLRTVLKAAIETGRIAEIFKNPTSVRTYLGF